MLDFHPFSGFSLINAWEWEIIGGKRG